MSQFLLSLYSFGYLLTQSDIALTAIRHSIAHEISRILYRFRSLGLLDVIGPAGHNSLQSLLQQMIDLLGAMERVVQTPLPFVFAVHLKQCVSLFLFVLPFTLVEQMGWRMVPLVTVVAFTLMGIEGIATEIEQPFGT